jgi:cyanophycinase-like exopeptidase
MNHGATGSPHTLNTYEQVGRRIQRLVSDPNVQKVQTIKIARRDDESPAAWERVIQELEETDGITVERLEEDSVRIDWQKYADL